METASDSLAYGGEAGGKHRKKPYRRPRTTPYDRRRLRTVQNPPKNNNNTSDGVGRGWLSRIVDPASKIIYGGAHKLFSSFFHSRLLPPPHPSQPPKEDEVVELENILKQKTFTRSERDRLTALLNSRTVDEKASGLSSCRSRRGGFDCNTHEDGLNLSQAPGTSSTPLASRSKVKDHVDFASSTQLPKACIRSKSAKRSSRLLDLQNQAPREQTSALASFQLHRPTCTTLQKPFSSAGTSHHDFGIPRTHGRSAMYNKTRTPYFRDSVTSYESNDASDGESLSSQKEIPTSGLNHDKEIHGEMFCKGSLVEVSSDEDGYQGAWFAATVVQVLMKGKYLVEYLEPRTDDDTEFMREEVDAVHIRPPPPEIEMIERFSLYERVDALQNDGWWVGVVLKVLVDSKYLVYFKDSNEKLKFSHDELRPHQDWVDGKWVTNSEDSVGVGLSALDS